MSKVDEFGDPDSAGYKNIIAIRDYSKDTRALVREMEQKFSNLEKLVLEQKATIEGQKQQIQALQMKVYSGGATTL